MFRAQTFGFYLVVFLVLVAARPKFRLKSAKNQIEVLSEGDSTGKHLDSLSWLYTKESSEASVTTEESTSEEPNEEGNSESSESNEESIGESFEESTEESYEDSYEDLILEEEFEEDSREEPYLESDEESNEESHGESHDWSYVAYTAWPHKNSHKQ